MSKNHPKYLSFLKKDRDKFLVEMGKLSTRAKGILEYSDMQSWDAFYYHLFVSHDVSDFRSFRNSGIYTEKELMTLMRNILNPDGRYSKEIEKFDYEFNLLSSRAKSVLKHISISLFETFYYRIVIEKEVFDFSKTHYCSESIRSEVEEFAESFCSYLGVRFPKKDHIIYFDPNNPKIPFIADYKFKKLFLSEFENLSKTTRSHLIKIGADTIHGFYTAFISANSPFNIILSEFGESDLLELLRFRTILKDNIKPG
jgi:hypothetical protein